MKSNDEILNEFGQLLIAQVFDNQNRLVRYSVEELAQVEEYQHLFAGMSAEQKVEMERYTYDMLSGALFELLKIFEENPQFKLVYEEGGRQVDLNTINPDLKTEPAMDGGWIERFSETLPSTELELATDANALEAFEQAAMEHQRGEELGDSILTKSQEALLKAAANQLREADELEQLRSLIQHDNAAVRYFASLYCLETAEEEALDALMVMAIADVPFYGIIASMVVQGWNGGGYKIPWD